MSVFVENLVATAKEAEAKIINVGTHSGCFHADELLAVAVLQEDLPEGWRVKMTRTRDPKALAECDLVVDVGGGRFDHHGKDKKLLPNGIPHAACTLLLEVIEENPTIRNILYNQLFYAVAAQDNGYECPDGIGPSKLTFVASMNPTWLEEATYKEDCEKAGKEAKPEELRSFAFYQTFGMVDVVYKRARSAAMAEVAAREKCDKAQQIELTQGGKVLVLEKFCLWLNWAYGHPEVVAAMYPEDGGWTVRVASKTPGKFDSRALFPETWGGLEGEKLEKASMIEGAVFCHRGLFIMKLKDREGALDALNWLVIQQ